MHHLLQDAKPDGAAGPSGDSKETAEYITLKVVGQVSSFFALSVVSTV